MTRRLGRWTYSCEHPAPNPPGWRLDETNLVLDFDPSMSTCGPDGAYVLWTDGMPGDQIDHYLDAAMRYVEDLVPPSPPCTVHTLARFRDPDPQATARLMAFPSEWRSAVPKPAELSDTDLADLITLITENLAECGYRSSYAARMKPVLAAAKAETKKRLHESRQS